MACQHCTAHFYELNDDSTLKHQRGCHDANFTAGQVYLKMLKDERSNNLSLQKVAYHGKENKISKFMMPSQKLVNLRNSVVDEVIFRAGVKLRQPANTQHLACKLFDYAFLH